MVGIYFLLALLVGIPCGGIASFAVKSDNPGVHFATGFVLWPLYVATLLLAGWLHFIMWVVTVSRKDSNELHR